MSGFVPVTEECESPSDCSEADPSLYKCEECKCVLISCGNGSIEQGEDCEQHSDCNERAGERCENCSCIGGGSDGTVSDYDSVPPTDTEVSDADSAPTTCLCAEGTLTVISGCDGWNDATECSGFHSVVCANEPHKSQSYCDYQNPDFESEFATQSVE